MQSEDHGNEFLGRLIKVFKIEQNEEIFKLYDKEITDIERIKELINETESISENECTIFYDTDDNTVAELAIADESMRMNRIKNNGIISESWDEENKIKYEISELTDFYVIWIFNKIFEKYPVRERITSRDRVLAILRDRTSRIRRMNIESSHIKLIDVMRSAINSFSLKVIKDKQCRIELDELINSYSYTYMCNMNEPIKVYSIEEIIGVLNRRDRGKNPDFEPPKRKYNKNLIDYYNLAVSSTDPFISFISYYHIIEYFYDEVFREQQVNSLRTNITAPRFSYKDDEQLFKIVEKIIKDNKIVRENGSGNEQQSLNYVLNKFINDLDEFKDRLTEDELNYYQNNIRKLQY